MTPATQLSLPAQVATQAEFIVNNFRQSDYQHKDNIDIDAGIYDCDCNGFVAFILSRFAPDHYALVPKETTQPRPRAFKYYDFFTSLTTSPVPGWERIHFMKDVQRGDVIAWREPVIKVGENTGHVFFAAETPTVNDAGIFKLRVYDSAAVAHFEDTRLNGATGVGTGFFNLRTDTTGAPTAFQFGPTLDQWATLPIAMGRLETIPTR